MTAPTIEEWRKLYALMAQVKELALWEWMNEAQGRGVPVQIRLRPGGHLYALLAPLAPDLRIRLNVQRKLPHLEAARESMLGRFTG